MKVKGTFALYRRHQLLDMKKRCVFVGKKKYMGQFEVVGKHSCFGKKKKNQNT